MFSWATISLNCRQVRFRTSHPANAIRWCIVKLAPNRDGVYQALSVHAAPVDVASPEVLIRGRITYGASCGSNRDTFCEKLTVRYNLESYFVPEGEGRKLEDIRNQGKLSVVAAVLPSGRAAIKRLLIDGKPVYEEPLF